MARARYGAALTTRRIDLREVQRVRMRRTLAQMVVLLPMPLAGGLTRPPLARSGVRPYKLDQALFMKLFHEATHAFPRHVHVDLIFVD